MNSKEAKDRAARWLEDLDSACPDCGHGPKWHGEYGCERMISGWCRCTRTVEDLLAEAAVQASARTL